MEFVPRAPKEGINVSPTHPLKEAATLVLGLGAILAVVFLLIGWSVDLVVLLIPPEAEARAFRSLELDLAALSEEFDDQGRQAELRRLLDRLVAHWPDTPYDFQVGIVPSDEPNALAVPGGYILVTTALLDEIESQNELAFVLGHELGHFRHRDHLRRLGRGMLYGLALSVIGLGGSVADLSTLVSELTGRGFDREQERDADRFGLELMHAEYGHVASSWRFFERLAEESPELEAMVTYLSTHPPSAERVAELKEFARLQGWSLAGPVHPF